MSGSQSSAAADNLIGQMVGSYRIERCIGQGGMGRVYEALHPTIGSRVAIKVLTRDVVQTPHIVERFFEEARSVNRIRHEGIVNVLDLGTLSDGTPFILMELLDGESLAELIARAALSPDRVVAIGCEVLDALAAAHAEGIIHRDIKPDNIFITRAGRVKILDFGIAKLLPDGAAMATATGSGLIGTPHYMAPEQAAGGRIDGRTDLYAVGLVLYEALTGVRAFDASSLYELLKQQVEVMPAPPRVHVPGVPEAIEAAIYQALAKLPEDRHADAATFAAALRGEVASDKLAVVSYDERPPAEVAHAATMVATPDPIAAAPQHAAAQTPLRTPSTLRGVADAAPPRSAASIGWLVGGAGLVAALLVGVAALWLLPLPSASSPARPPPEASASEGEAPQLSAPSYALEPGFDSARFDAIGYAPVARARAARLVGRPRLMVLSAHGIDATGHVALSGRNASVSYVFAARDGRRCVKISVLPDQVMTKTDPRGDCPQKRPTRMPRCTLEQLVATATHGMKLPKGLSGSFSYVARDGAPEWTVRFDSGLQRRFPDSC